MQINRTFIILISTPVLFPVLTANAQHSIWQKAKDKASEKTGAVLKKKTDNTTTNGQENAVQPEDAPFDFVPGDSLLFTEDFSTTKPGSSPASIKSNGNASVTTANGAAGRWMVLQDKSIYKLSRQLFYPRHFTVEFDLLASADQVKDIAPLSFGFAADNSVREYMSNTGGYVQLHYYDGDQVNVGSSRSGKFVNTTFDLGTDLNRPLHIAITVEGDRMAVYLNKTKLADTDIFSSTDAKNFYINAPWQYENGARVMISHLRIATFKK